MRAVSSDYYTILGVTPSAEDVVIGAAYRALMRHYHPDTNRDPGAQARAREITAAYAVLRDPHSRAAYDAGRAAGLGSFDEAELRPPPPMRAAGIASAVLALGLVVAVWAWPKASPPNRVSHSVESTHTQAEPVAESVKPPLHLEPEHERLAKLAASNAPPPRTVEPIIVPDEPIMSPPPPAPRVSRNPSATVARA